MRGLEKTFFRLKDNKEGGLIAYVTAGDPSLAHTPQIVDALVNGGADIIELGIPFSDPIADGPTIQAGAVRALKARTTPKKIMETVKQIKRVQNVPIVLLTYYNSIFRMGLQPFFESAEISGVEGVIVPDLPIEEAKDYKRIAQTHEIDTIFLAAPSSSAKRLQEIANYTTGFLYLVSVFGVTGTRETIQEFTMQQIRKTNSITRGKVPLAVGFGVSKPEHIELIVQNGADAAIVGSGFVRIIEKESTNEEKMLQKLEKYAHQLKKATKCEC